MPVISKAKRTVTRKIVLDGMELSSEPDTRMVYTLASGSEFVVVFKTRYYLRRGVYTIKEYSTRILRMINGDSAIDCTEG